MSKKRKRKRWQKSSSNKYYVGNIFQSHSDHCYNSFRFFHTHYQYRFIYFTETNRHAVKRIYLGFFNYYHRNNFIIFCGKENIKDEDNKKHKTNKPSPTY